VVLLISFGVVARLRNSGKTGGKSPNGNLPAQMDINHFNRMPGAFIPQA